MGKVFFTALLISLLATPAWAGLIVQGDGTVLDDEKGILWIQDPTSVLPQGVNFATAEAAVNSLVFAGYDDWLMPFVNTATTEIVSLSVSGAPFVNMPNTYWLDWVDDDLAGGLEFNAGISGASYDCCYPNTGSSTQAGVIAFRYVSVPEPGTLGILSLGLLALGFARRKAV